MLRSTGTADTWEVINGRHTSRGQINYAVPDALRLQRRTRRHHADHGIQHGIQHGDIVAMALDALPRAKGYPPDLPNRISTSVIAEVPFSALCPRTRR